MRTETTLLDLYHLIIAHIYYHVSINTSPLAVGHSDKEQKTGAVASDETII